MLVTKDLVKFWQEIYSCSQRPSFSCSTREYLRYRLPSVVEKLRSVGELDLLNIVEWGAGIEPLAPFAAALLPEEDRMKIKVSAVDIVYGFPERIVQARDYLRRVFTTINKGLIKCETDRRGIERVILSYRGTENENAPLNAEFIEGEFDAYSPNSHDAGQLLIFCNLSNYVHRESLTQTIGKNRQNFKYIAFSNQHTLGYPQHPCCFERSADIFEMAKNNGYTPIEFYEFGEDGESIVAIMARQDWDKEPNWLNHMRVLYKGERLGS